VAAEAPLNRHWLLDASLSYDGNGAHAAFDLVNFGESLKSLALRGTEKGSMISYQMFNGTDTSSIDNRIIIANKASTATDTSYPATVKPWDAGITIIAGIQWPHLRLSPSSLVYWIHGR
jgi:hypothetical protein